MSYVSLSFPLFIATVFLLYFAFPAKWRWVVLLAASYVFYALSDVRCLFFVAVTTASTFYAARLIGSLDNKKNRILEQNRDVWSDSERDAFIRARRKKSRMVLICALLITFGILGFLKYFNFAAGSLSMLLGLPKNLWQLDILLPIGISFYTFQSAGYIIDVYRGAYEPDRNIAKYALFVSFFPQVLQGPIGRHDDLAAQLTAPNSFRFENLRSGLQLVLWGYFKKLVIADRIAALVAAVFDGGGEFGFFVNAAATLAYGLQIYCDFSGGIDISRGIAEVMGIKMAENFRRPYFAQTVSEYWKRWHITLGNWTRDYIFYPVVLSKGMSRLGRKIRKKIGGHTGKVLPACMASLLCFLIIGIWHGAAWKFVFYGLYYGFIISLSQILEPVFDRVSGRLKIDRERFSWRLFRMLRTLLLVSLGRSFTRSGGFMSAVAMLRASLTRWDPWTLYDGTFIKLGLSEADCHILFAGIIVLLAVGIMQEKGICVRAALNRQNLWFRWAVMIAAALAVLLFGVYGAGYSASSFIYAQF